LGEEGVVLVGIIISIEMPSYFIIEKNSPPSPPLKDPACRLRGQVRSDLTSAASTPEFLCLRYF
jgi:hypothetical protein